MSRVFHQPLALLILLVVSGCTNTPTSPALPSLELSNFRVRPLGLESAACGRPGTVSYRALDELEVDYRTTGGTVLGAILFNRRGVGRPEALGTSVQACVPPVDPCQARGQVCIVSGDPASRGTLRTTVGIDWQPTTTWNLTLAAEAGISNAVSATIARTDGLPSGNTAGIYNLTMVECDYVDGLSNSPCFINPAYFNNARSFFIELAIYHPRVSGRRVTAQIEAFSSGRRVYNQQMDAEESSASTNLFAWSAQFLSPPVPPPPYRVVATIRETQGASVIVAETREIAFP